MPPPTRIIFVYGGGSGTASKLLIFSGKITERLVNDPTNQNGNGFGKSVLLVGKTL